MIEVTLRNYLESELSVPVLLEAPTDKSLIEYVLLEKTGSSYSDHINSATFAVQSYSDTLYGAASLNELVKTALMGDGTTSYGITASEDISRCELNGDYNYTDTTTKSYRYQAVYDLVF